MKCPLKFNKENEVVDGHILIQENCEEERCAWWVIPYDRTEDAGCAIYRLALKTYNVEAHVIDKT